MANTAAVYARIDTHLKSEAEGVLSQLGITPSSAIQMFYAQIIRTRGIPFPLSLSYHGPAVLGSLTRDELDAELRRGLASMKDGKGLSASEVDAKLSQELGL